MLRGSVLLLALLALLVSVDGQRWFRQVTERTQKWAAREKANIEFVRKTTTFRDGLAANARSTTLTNYFVSALSAHSSTQRDSVLSALIPRLHLLPSPLSAMPPLSCCTAATASTAPPTTCGPPPTP